MFDCAMAEGLGTKDPALMLFVPKHCSKPKRDVMTIQDVRNAIMMRRTHASLMRDLGVDPKVVADLSGHDVGMTLSVYTQTSIKARQQAVETLGNALVN